MNTPTILIIEDEKELRELYADIFTDYRLTFAATGREAVEIIYGGSRFDLYIVDIGLPDIDGFEVMHHIRSGHPQAHIMVVTGYPPQSISQKLDAVHPDEVLPKPFDLTRLLSATEKLTGLTPQPTH